MDRFKASAAEAPQPNPYRFTLKKLGITKEEFDTRLEAEVEEALTKLAALQRLVAPPALCNLLNLRSLSRLHLSP